MDLEPLMDAWDNLNRATQRIQIAQANTMTQRADELETARLAMMDTINALARKAMQQ